MDAAGQWRKRDDVWIAYLDRKGPLTVGYGARPDKIGPELGFGWVMGDALDEPVLLIKCAWGGKSLAVDFRPPSAGKPPYSLGEKADAVGKYYRETLLLTKAALANIKDLVPGSDGSYVLSGFGWHQGWNDRVNEKFNAEYEGNMAHFIRDMRKDLAAPALPFVIAETGMCGPDEKHPRALALMKAQAAVAERPEFKGNVAFVGTRAFWRPKEQSPNGQGYHWNCNAETYYLIGEAMGEAMKRLTRAVSAFEARDGKAPIAAPESKDIKAYCLDFNWAATARKRKPFATPGTWAGADPAQHVAWYKAVGANVIQTFCVSNNGYAWYKNGFVPEQPGLKHDFLPEVVKLGHQEGMLVMGYFCVAANAKWGKDHPDLSYGTPTTYHIPYTDEYLAHLSKSVSDAVKKTGIDGIMIDWVWQPNRDSTGGKWLECEKKLYAHLMNEPFPGEEAFKMAPRKQRVAYNRKAIERCWKAICKSAKDANPNCIIWLTSNNPISPDVVDSDMYKEVDWLMNERGDKKSIDAVHRMVGKQTRLITCLADWNGQDATKVVPEALKAGIGLYGFTAPRNEGGLVPLGKILSRPVGELKDDDRNIAALARAYHGASVKAIWDDKKGQFVEPAQ
jgi:hypothetical protein